LKKGIYKPTKQNIIIVDELEDYCEILLDGEYKTVLNIMSPRKTINFKNIYIPKW